MRKNISMLSLLLVLFAWLSPDVQALTEVAVVVTGNPQEKEHTVKVVVRKNGKQIEKDSTFVDHGKDISFSGDSIQISESGTGTEKKVTQIIIINEDRGKEGKGTKSCTYAYSTGDTLQNDIPAKVARLGEQKRLIIMQESEGGTSDSQVTSPGTAVWVEGHQMKDPYAFDSADPNIVSYKKKDLGKGQEKITIVRKKVVMPEEKK